MRKLASATLVVIAAATLPLTSVAVVSASPANGRLPYQMPLGEALRGCNHAQLNQHNTTQTGRAFALLTTSGSNTVTADVTIALAPPDNRYFARLIQVPRTQLTCNAGDPGVIAGEFQTDANGAGAVKLSGPIQSGATGAWIVLDRPAYNSQTPAEFYTSNFVAAI